MNISVTGKHTEVGESLKEHSEQALARTVTQYLDDFLEGLVVIEKDGHLFKTDISAHISHNWVVRCHGEDSDPYRSVDVTLSKLEKRIRRHKTRLKDRKRYMAREEKGSQSYESNSVQSYILSGEDETEHQEPLVIAEMPHEILTSSVGEAVMMMDLSDEPVYVFRNARNGEVNVLHRREDGNIGWIDPSQTLKK